MIMGISAFFSLFGRKGHILDGPGMVNKAQWTAFTLSRSDSYAQHNFSFTVKDDDDGAFVMGFCRDEDGTLYENESGIPIPPETVTALRQLGIDELEDVPQTITDDSGEWEEPVLLDASSLKFSVVYYKDLNVDKAMTMALSTEIYEILLPLFAESGS